MEASHPRAIILAGPTACGKTALSDRLALKFPIEIINADMGQFYSPCSVGTAKPDWRNQPAKHHLFDIVDEPRDVSVVEYRKKVIQLVTEIESRGRVPLLVGGSFFYLSSLFFPPHENSGSSIEQTSIKKQYEHTSTSDLWAELNAIDAVRAAAIHSNDRYRTLRALTLWHTSHMLPSSQAPIYMPPFEVLFLVLMPSREILYERIDTRTREMFNRPDGWLQEARYLYGSPWEAFLRQKKLIGYPEIFDWLAAGARQEQLEMLIKLIQQGTRKYAKRQITFWRRMRTLLEDASKKDTRECRIIEISDLNDATFDQLLSSIRGFVSHKKE